MTIVFMGTPQYATQIFEALHNNAFCIKALYTQPDKPVGRKKILTPPHIKTYCKTHNIDLPIHQPTTLKDDKTIEQIRSYAPQYIVVAAYGQILPRKVLEIAPCINLHSSLLPLYRGASPIHHALLHNHTHTGVTAMLMDEGLDTGDILGFRLCPITPDATIEMLFLELGCAASWLIQDTLKRFDEIDPKPQINCLASYAKKIVKADGLVQLDDAKTLYNTYRAYKTWPGVYLDSGLKLIEIIGHTSTPSTQPKGTILSIQDASIKIACSKGALEITQVQPMGKKPMNAKAYLLGARLQVGDLLS